MKKFLAIIAGLMLFAIPAVCYADIAASPLLYAIPAVVVIAIVAIVVIAVVLIVKLIKKRKQGK